MRGKSVCHTPEVYMRTIVLVQARMGSNRLPGKHLKEVLGKPLIAYLFERLHRIQRKPLVVLNTTVQPKDDILAQWAADHAIPFFRGSEEDVLLRYFHAAQAFSADSILRICGDCPLIDPAVIDKVLDYFIVHSPHLDYVSNTLQRTYPRGMDAEIFSMDALKVAVNEAHQSEEREHVTPYFYRHPDQFHLANVAFDEDMSKYRWTVDTEEDFALVSKLIEELYPKKNTFTLADLVECMCLHPQWYSINSTIQQKKLTDES